MTLVLERETLIPPTIVVEKADAYADYVAGGGNLTREYYEYVSGFHSDTEINMTLTDTTNRSSRYQAEGMDQRTGVGLTDRQVSLYMVLRNLPIPQSPNQEAVGSRPQSLSDQVLLAEVLRITDPGKYSEFTAYYPNIFPQAQPTSR